MRVVRCDARADGAGGGPEDRPDTGYAGKGFQRPGACGEEASVSKQDRDRAEELFLKGAKDVERDDLSAAIDVFARAAALDPGNPKYGMSEDIARQHRVTELVQQADKARNLRAF